MMNTTQTIESSSGDAYFLKTFAEVYYTLGGGYKENLYQTALSIEYSNTGINHSLEVVIPVLYKGQYIGFERADIVIYNNSVSSVIIEIKAQHTAVSKKEFNQLNKYLVNTNTNTGYLVNFFSTPTKITPNTIVKYLEIYKIENEVLYKFDGTSFVIYPW